MIATSRAIDVLVNADNKKYERAGYVAKHILGVAHICGQELRQQMCDEGVSYEQIVEQWHMALALASVELTLMQSEALQICTIGVDHG